MVNKPFESNHMCENSMPACLWMLLIPIKGELSTVARVSIVDDFEINKDMLPNTVLGLDGFFCAM